MSINDILAMEVDKTGKLVTPEELEEMEQATTDAENGEMPEGTDVPAGEAPAGEAPAGEAPAGEVPAGGEVPTGDTAGEEAGPENLVIDVINEMTQNEDFIKAFDADGSQDISDEELEAFLNLANNFDGDLENLSVDDLMEGMETILNGEDLEKVIEEDFAPIEESANEELPSIEETPADNQTEGVSQPANTSPASSTGGAPTRGGSNNLGEIAPKTLDNMSLDELKTELGKAQDSLKGEQDALSAIRDGSNPELKGLQDEIDKAYEAYQEQLKAVDEDLAKEVDDLKTQIDGKDQEINQQKQAISQQESTIANAQSAYDNAHSTTESLKGRKGELEAKATAEQDPTKKAAIEAQIAALEAEIATAEAAETEAKTALDQAQAALEPLKTTLEGLEGEKADLEAQMAEKEAEVREKYPEVAEYMDKYKEAQKAYDDKETSLTTEAQKGVTEAQDYVAEVEEAINEKKTTEKLKEYQTGDYDAERGQSLVDSAYSMLDKYGSSKGYCATGVSRTFAMEYGLDLHGNGCDWDSNMDQLVEQGMFKEVTSEYASASDLSSLPAGAVVCWEATGGSSGGAKYGHVTIADGKGGEISDHHASNIYTNVGGRSDQYRVYIPIS